VSLGCVCGGSDQLYVFCGYLGGEMRGSFCYAVAGAPSQVAGPYPAYDNRHQGTRSRWQRRFTSNKQCAVIRAACHERAHSLLGDLEARVLSAGATAIVIMARLAYYLQCDCVVSIK
jgi:hypothetical protein